MSHLPLDARAILQHLNELGYRNISAEQLREFLKGMQPQSDKQSAIKSKLSTAAAAATTTTTRANPQQQPQPELHQQRPKIKVIKSKRPLCHFKFYLDICDHQLTKRIESEIKTLGGALEFFLNDSITHFITDKETTNLAVTSAAAVNPKSRSRPGTPLTPATPNTPSASAVNNEDVTGIQRKGRQTRADTILSRVREAQQQSPSNPSPSPSQPKQQRGKQTSYIVWQTEHALRFFLRIQTELRQYLQVGAEGSVTGGTGNADRSANIQLKGNFIKIESIKRNHRPYYHLLKQPDEWPKLDLTSDDGAFRLQAKKAVDVQSMTRKSFGSRTSQRQQDNRDKEQEKEQPLQVVPLQHAAVQACKKQTESIQTPESPRSHYNRELKESTDKQCGVCEICKIEYDTLAIHLQSKDHELFAKNANNFLELDTLIQVSASLNGFLEREEKEQQQETETEQKDIEIYSDMDVDELLSDSAIALTLKSINNPTDNLNNSSGNNNNTNKQRPSPVLREKSKRITKGKHSSEKFQATTPTNSPTNPQKVTSLLELQRMDNDTTTTTTGAATPTNQTRRKTNNSVLSPPMRAMLPPSSLYKVVQEASDANNATPPRMRRGGATTNANNMDSPSLIVKFQKVRQSELQRLNGEAENFMFPRTTTTTTTRSSSELLTDVDRQTTSDPRGHHSISSTSIDSTSELDVSGACSTSVTTPACPGRAAAVGRRRKGTGAGVGTTTGVLRQLSTGSSSSNGSGQQRFPSAPIQPEMQSQSQSLKSRQSTTTAAATRKSSRMATAIVTAATTSSQLQLRQKTQSKRGGKLEDGMGEQTKTTTQRKKTAKQVVEKKEQEEEEQQIQLVVKQEMQEEDEDEDEDEDVSSCSSGSDEDYVVTNTKLHKLLPGTNRVVDTREERAARRLSRLTISSIKGRAGEDAEELATLIKKSTAGRRSNKSQKLSPNKSSKQAKQQTPAATSTPATSSTSSSKEAPTSLANELMFDCSKSARLQKLRYAFEKLPSSELWHHVFQRQDAGEEHYYSYYGSTRYHKLPYEMGPIPMERTKSHSCQMCRRQTIEIESKPQIKLEREQLSDSNQTATTTTTGPMYKHKKLHLLQRYQQEQQQQLKIAVPPLAKCDSKASTPELMERDLAPLTERAQLLEVERVRAASTQSTQSASSSCSNSQKSGSINSQTRNKQLARVVDLPPRKSPREHASTLALVSCIIRQRQDSQSKTNSEAEEPPPVAPPSSSTAKLKKPIKQEKELEPEPEAVVATTPHKTRSQAATPVEELRFATEISETVKRMRRGQNKYDVVPTPTKVTDTSTAMSARCRRPTAAAVSYSRRLELARREVNSSSKRQQRRPTSAAVRPNPQQPPGTFALAAGVRKLPSKKGLLEYEMEDRALKALDASMQYVNPMLIAWQIDKYLELTNRDYDLNLEEELPVSTTDDPTMRDEVQTPPPTDYGFTSEFDLCDLLANSAGSGDEDEVSNRTGCRRNSRTNLFSSYQRKRKCLKSNRTGWPRVQRRRAARALNEESINFRELGVFENLKTRKGLKQEPLETEEEQTTTTTTTTTTAADKEAHREADDDHDGGEDDGDGDGDADIKTADKEPTTTRENAVMTPPATDVDEQVDADVEGDNEDSIDEEEEEAVANIVNDDDDDETMADSVDQQPNDEEAEIEATDADVEEDEDEDEEDDNDDNDMDEDEDVFEDAYDEMVEHEQETQQDPLELPADEPPAKRERITITKNPLDNSARSPAKEHPLIRLNGYCLNHVTSTPSTRQPRHQQHHHHRRTPQLNGSLGSCISPSEKLGDNSDIFTVSSDGLDTDMDLSNTQAGDSIDHCQHQHQHLHHPTTTPPKRKFDISKYAPPNNGKAASSCAAEAATAAVKSLAISQFLKKEVRVTCRRLRAPFRRFRYRR